MNKYGIAIEPDINVGQIVEIQGLGTCLVIGFASTTGATMFFSYKLQEIIGII